jgi:NitT/TauT family transport system substrate-binding protein
VARRNAHGRHYAAVRQIRRRRSGAGARTLTRTRFLAATGAALASAPRRARAQGLTTLRVSGSPDQDIVATLWGVQSGIFARYGLDIQLTRSNSGPAVSSALLGGSLEIGKSSLFSLVVGHAKGVAFQLEAPASIWNTETPQSALVVAKGSPFRAARDLNGKTVSVPGLGDLYNVGISAWIDQHGGDSQTVKFVEMPHRAAAEAIAAGRIAAAELAPPILNDALQNGQVQIFGRANDAIGKHFISTAYVCTADYAAKNVDVLARFRKALNEAAVYANANRAKMIPLLATYSGVDPKVVAAIEASPVGVASQLVPRMIQPMIDAAVKYKSISAPFPAKDMIDPNALPAT